MTEIRHTLDCLIRRERGRLIADLVRRLGVSHIELIEDVTQEALIAAMESWRYKGMPDNPGGWLARVARNKAIDRLRRLRREISLGLEEDNDPYIDEIYKNPDQDFFWGLEDPELRLIFLSCHDELTEFDRLVLTLSIVSGFTANEISELFLQKPAAIAQRLARSKRKLRTVKTSLIETPLSEQRIHRIPTVLKVIYLMFSLGYAPHSGMTLMKRDVANEALRLSCALVDQHITDLKEARALASLLCFQASRFDARQDTQGDLVLLRDHDRDLWDKTLIARAMHYLDGARGGNHISRYHLEAAIAAHHATAPSWEETDWHAIRTLYEKLETITASPVVSVNACIAIAFDLSPDEALSRLDALASIKRLEEYTSYHLAKGEILYQLGRNEEAKTCLEKAMACGASEPVLRHLKMRMQGDEYQQAELGFE